MNLKTKDEIQRMREAGLLLWQAHELAASLVVEGIATAEIDASVDEFITVRNAVALFKGVPGRVPYPAATCISVNEQVVHGIPSPRKLRGGDIVSIDIGLKLNGWCADAAVTHPVGAIDAQKAQLLEVTGDALRYAVGRLADQVRWSRIARAMQKRVERHGFSVVRNLVGHGIGREMWEWPEVPNYWNKNLTDFRLRPGMVLAIEPMINIGGKAVKICNDHWTIVTRDAKPSAHFEHTVAVTAEGPQVLTCGPGGEGWTI